MKTKRDYFPHDFHARDELHGVMRRYGMGGVGIFWCLVEILHEEGGELPLEMLPDIAYQLHIDDELLRDFVLNSGMFTTENNMVLSRRVIENLKIINEKVERLKEASNARWRAEKKANEGSDPEPNDEPRQEPRQEESQGCKMTLEQALEYARIDSLSYIDPNKFFRYYGTKTWKNEDEWKAVMRRWNETDKAKVQRSQPNETSSFTGNDLATALARSYAGTGIDPTKD